MKVQFTQKDLETSKYLGEGEHEVTVTKITEKTSRAGAPMEEIEFTSSDGKITRDFLMGSYMPKIAQVALACGIQKEVLLSGEFDTNMLRGKKLKLVRRKSGKRTYVKDGQTKETDDYENNYLVAEATFADEQLPF